MQRQGWDSTFDGGVATVKFGLDVLATGRSVLEIVTIAVLLVAIALVVISIRQRVAWPLVLYGTLVLAMDLGANGLMNSKARLLLPAFTLLIPAAIGLAKRRARHHDHRTGRRGGGQCLVRRVCADRLAVRHLVLSRWESLAR